MIAAQIFSLAIAFLYYRYLSYLWAQGRKFLNGMVVFLTAGIMCSFVDVVFWGGSLDFLRLFDWFTFDLKDVYLNVGVISALIFCVNYYLKKYSKLSKEERRQTSILLWIRKCMLSSARE
jgi:signal peptidase II